MKKFGRRVLLELYKNPTAFMDIILPEYHDIVKTALKEQWDGKQTDIIYCIKREDGTIKWIRDKAFPLIDEANNINKVIGVAEDISDKKVAEDKLKDALRRERKAVTEIEEVTGRVAFLSEATAILNSSLDYKLTLDSLGKLLTPEFADWFIVDILENNGKINHLTISNENPDKVELVKKFREKYPPGKNVDTGVYKVVSTKKSEFYSNIKNKLLKEYSANTEYYKLIKELKLKSIMIIPLIARGIVLGAITIGSSKTGKRFKKEDLSFAENLAQRAAIAIDNAILYKESKNLNEKLEQRVKERTHQLEKTNIELHNEINERKKIEDILREQAQVIDQIHDSVISTDLEGYIINWNNGSEKIFGYKAEEMIGKHISKLFTKSEFNFLRDEIINPLKEKGNLEVEVKLVRKSGDVFNGLLSLSILNDSNGKLRGMIGYTMDITERKKAEEALRKAHDELELRVQERTSDLIKTNEALQEEIIERRRAEKALIERDQRLRASLEASETGTFRWDIQTNQIELDENLQRMLGKNPGTKVTNLSDYIDFIHPNDLTNFKTAIEKCVNEGTDFDMEYRIIWPDQSIHWLLDKGKTIKDDEGKPLYMTGACVDITEMKAVKKERADLLNEIEKQKLRIDNIISTIPGVVWETWGRPDEEKQRLDYVNNYVETMLGYTTKEWLETPNFWLSIVHPDDKEKAAREAKEIFDSGKGGTSQYRWITKDGNSVWVETQSVVFKNAENKPVGMRGVSLDISERKKAQQMIETSLREKEILLKEIHHRVKNNLQILSSLLNLQSNYMKDKHALEVFKESQNRIKSMALVHEKLYQSKDLFKIDFQGYVRDLTSNLVKSYRVKTSAVRLKLEVEDIFLSIDEAITLGLIINELVSNSLKYAFPEGKEGELCVSLKSLDNDSSELKVKDNGIGLPEGFNIKETGTLGIQLVDTLTEQLDGIINIENKNGAEFKIKFPLHQEF